MELDHLSVYRYDVPATKEDIKRACKTLTINFTDQADGFWTMLIKYLVEAAPGKQWLEDMTNHTITNYPYKHLCVHDVLKFDKLIHTLTWAETDKMVKDGRKAELGLLADGDHEWVVLKSEMQPYGIRVRDFAGYNYTYNYGDAL